eukprot:c12382_g3_i1 orf=480-809(-)
MARVWMWGKISMISWLNMLCLAAPSCNTADEDALMSVQLSGYYVLRPGSNVLDAIFIEVVSSLLAGFSLGQVHVSRHENKQRLGEPGSSFACAKVVYWIRIEGACTGSR